MPKESMSFPPDPIFNEYLYTILYNASAIDKRRLKGKYLKAAMSEKAAKNFIQNASLEDKIYIMCELGHRFFVTFLKEDFKQEALTQLLQDFEKDRKPKALRDIIQQGIFVSSDVNFNRLLGHVSRSIHHHNFYLDLELQRVGFQIKKWRKRSVNPKDLEVREADENASHIAHTLLSGAICMDYVKGLLGVTHAEMKILLYLYTQPHIFVSEKYMGNYFKGYIRDAEVRVAMRNLSKSGHIQVDKVPEKRYTITGSGTKICNEYFKVVFTKLNF